MYVGTQEWKKHSSAESCFCVLWQRNNKNKTDNALVKRRNLGDDQIYTWNNFKQKYKYICTLCKQFGLNLNIRSGFIAQRPKFCKFYDQLIFFTWIIHLFETKYSFFCRYFVIEKMYISQWTAIQTGLRKHHSTYWKSYSYIYSLFLVLGHQAHVIYHWKGFRVCKQLAHNSKCYFVPMNRMESSKWATIHSNIDSSISHSNIGHLTLILYGYFSNRCQFVSSLHKNPCAISFL